jgi:hypothetical protein
LSPAFSSTTKKPNLELRPRRKIILGLLISLGILFFTLYIFADNAVNLYEKYFVNNDKQVIIYLDTVNQNKIESSAILENIQLKFYRNYLNKEDYNNEIKSAHDDLQQMIHQTIELNPPKKFSQHKASFLKVLNQEKLVLTLYQETKETNGSENLNKSLSDLTYKQEMEKIALLKSFKNAGVKYKQLGNGTILYWYKTHSGKSLSGKM